MPWRTPWLLARTVVLAALVLVTGVLLSIVTFGIRCASAPAVAGSVADPAAIRAVLGRGLYLSVPSVLALAVAAMLRSTGGVVVMFTLIFVIFVAPAVTVVGPLGRNAVYLPGSPMMPRPFRRTPICRLPSGFWNARSHPVHHLVGQHTWRASSGVSVGAGGADDLASGKHTNVRRSVAMTARNKVSTKLEQAKGAAKEAMGRVVGNERMTGEGRYERAKGELRQAAEKLRDATRR